MSAIHADGMHDVWAEDAVALKAIARNRVPHPLCKAVTLRPPLEHPPRVALLLDTEDCVMARHQPLPRQDWDAAAAAGIPSERLPGQLSTFEAAISSNERPERVISAGATLRESGLAGQCVKLEGRYATKEELLRVHTTQHVERLLAFRDPECCSKSEVLRVASSCNTVFMNEHSVRAATFAVGSCIAATEAVLGPDPVDAAVCVVRPPGHHSDSQCAMGFGLFNSVAAAAGAGLAKGLTRVLVVDLDIHHGNGTQSIFQDDPRVLYISAHSLYAYPAFAADGQLELQSP
eukprot:Hpha_TRINITY_DN26858_c0_g1::TRINITY_DN26858_c0_g1_i1::g.17312::m.17312/K11407/HDAC6; histone deacetylase 6